MIEWTSRLGEKERELCVICYRRLLNYGWSHFMFHSYCMYQYMNNIEIKEIDLLTENVFVSIFTNSDSALLKREIEINMLIRSWLLAGYSSSNPRHHSLCWLGLRSSSVHLWYFHNWPRFLLHYLFTVFIILLLSKDYSRQRKCDKAQTIPDLVEERKNTPECSHYPSIQSVALCRRITH